MALGSTVGEGDAQIRDQVIVYVGDVGPITAAHRYSLDLTLLGTTDLSAETGILSDATPIAVDESGAYWIANNPATVSKLTRLGPLGQLLPSVDLAPGHHPQAVAASPWGDIFVAGRIGAMTPMPMYAVSPGGSILWSNIAGPGSYLWAPMNVAVTRKGEVWLAESAPPVGGGGHEFPQFVRVDPADGSVLSTYVPPLPCGSGTSNRLARFTIAPDGTMWTYLICHLGIFLHHTDGTSSLGLYPASGGDNGASSHMWVDPQGDPWLVSEYSAAGAWGAKIQHYSGQNGALIEVFEFDKTIAEWAFGPTGEVVYANIGADPLPFGRRLTRLNLRTGVSSSLQISPNQHQIAYLATGDPTGFLFANAIDPGGDNDGDGARNHEETSAGSNPFDAESRPGGPKVGLSFAAGSNAIVLDIHDPDGLLDPIGGIDPSTLSVVAGGFGEVLPVLLPYLTQVTLDPNGEDATVEFGALPIPDDLKVRLTVTVRDHTGKKGWDWQVTPPGHL